MDTREFPRTPPTGPAEEISANGFAVIPGVYTDVEIAAWLADWEAAVGTVTDEAVSLRSRDALYGARNVLQIWPQAAEMWRRPQLVTLLRTVLGPQVGLVRVLFFDKPPDRTWSVPWHRDLTIAVRDNSLASPRYTKPTWKAGVAHVQPPLEILRKMLTLRIHLDAMTPENGPLQVLPGSHEIDCLDESASPVSHAQPRFVYVGRGDVMAMRPLLSHASIASLPTTTLHRRVLHLEFSGQPDLTEGFEWLQFVT